MEHEDSNSPLEGGPPDRPRGKRPWKKIVGFSIAAVIIIVMTVFVLPTLVDWSEVWNVITDLSWQQLLVLIAATIFNILTFAPPWMAALPGLRARQALVVTQASTASTYVAPGGPAVGMALSYAMLRGWGFQTQAVALAVTVTGIWNQLAMLSFPVIALTALTITGGTHALLQTVALIGASILVVAVAAFAAALSSENMADRIGEMAARGTNWIKRRLHRKPVTWSGASVVVFRRGAIDLLRHRWHILTIATFVGQLSVFAVLVASLWALNVYPDQVTLVEAFAAWSISRLLGSIPITPGGIGVVEVGLTTALTAFGGSLGLVVASVLIFRFMTIVPTLGLGLLAGATWRKHAPEESPEGAA